MRISEMGSWLILLVVVIALTVYTIVFMFFRPSENVDVIQNILIAILIIELYFTRRELTLYSMGK
jgi:uncharacterized membrane protein (DUF373 family)